ncbi:ParB/RepB/Spo0J family partition protein (plasmid) [Mycetohabitans endofungorum]|uniref:ParB/RepB/Spo0J family partition protein n=1 Tax=Mycetohabitans endofungorum TaxID=417203 RepID=UPI0030CC26EB
MKSSQLARGFQARPDTTTSEKRTALERLNAIDTWVKQPSSPDTPEPVAIAKKDGAPDPSETITPCSNESAAYRAWRTANGYTPGQVIELPLKAIKPSPFNPRHFYLKSSIAELAVNLAKQGQQQAIHVIPDHQNPGTFFVSDGGRRVRALREANKESVRAIVVDLPIGIESYKLGYDLNVQRDSQTVFDNAIVWRRFLDEQHFQSQRELAEHLGIDESTVAVALGIAKLPEAVMQEMVARPDRFGSNMAYQVARYHSSKGTDATLRLINKIVADDLSTRQVADIVKGRAVSSDAPKPLRRQRYAQRLEIKVGGATLGDLKSYGDDRLELKLKGLTREKRDELLAQIEALLMPKTSDTGGRGANTTNA